MNRAQKTAWFILAVLGVALGLSLAAFCVAYFVLGYPASRAAWGFGFIGIVGLVGLEPVLFRKGEGAVQCDERDRMIQHKASLTAYSVFWGLFVAATMVPWFIAGPEGRISVNYLPGLVFGGMIVVLLVRAIVTLNQYGWTNRETTHE